MPRKIRLPAEDSADLSYIAEPLRQFAVLASALSEDPTNARIHPDRNIEAIRRSLVQFGQQRAVLLAGDGVTVIAGNGTLRASRLLERPYIAAMITGLEGSDARAYGLADNRTTESSEWDDEAVSALLADLTEDKFNVSSLGWSTEDMDALLGGLPEPEFEDTERPAKPSPSSTSDPIRPGATTASIPDAPAPLTGTPVTDPAKEWVGMPEFAHEDQTAFRSIVLHFANTEDVARFAELVNQPITPKTRFLWYPEAEIGHYADKRYAVLEP